MSGLSLAQRIAARGLTDLLADVAQRHHVTPADVLGRGRTYSVSAARRTFILALRERGMSLPEIGYMLDRNHTSILYVVNETRRAKSDARARSRGRSHDTPFVAHFVRGFRSGLEGV